MRAQRRARRLLGRHEPAGVDCKHRVQLRAHRRSGHGHRRVSLCDCGGTSARVCDHLCVPRGLGNAAASCDTAVPFLAGKMGGGILVLGAPQSLNFIGLALGSAAIITALQWVGRPGYADTITTYGIITRVITFAFLPLLGLSFAMQTIMGNTMVPHFGTGLMQACAWRSGSRLFTALWWRSS